MQLGTLLSMTTSGQLAAAAGIARLAPSLYRPCWLAAAGRAGVLTALAEGPQPLETLAARLEVGPEGRDALLSWLSVGVSLGELARAGDTWRLRSSLSRRLAQPEHDPALAALGAAGGTANGNANGNGSSNGADQLQRARQIARDDPRIVANIVKSWVNPNE